MARHGCSLAMPVIHLSLSTYSLTLPTTFSPLKLPHLEEEEGRKERKNNPSHP